MAVTCCYRSLVYLVPPAINAIMAQVAERGGWFHQIGVTLEVF